MAGEMHDECDVMQEVQEAHDAVREEEAETPHTTTTEKLMRPDGGQREEGEF